MKKNLLFLSICILTFLSLAPEALGAGCPPGAPQSTTKDQTSSAYYCNSIESPQLTANGKEFLESKGVVNTDGTIDQAKLTALQSSLGIPADGKLGGTSAGNVNTKVTSANAGGPSPAPQDSIPTGGNPTIPTTSSTSPEGPTKVIVTEKIPGAKCDCVITVPGQDGPETSITPTENGDACKFVPVAQRKYECTVEKGLAGFQKMFQAIVKWVVYVTMLLGVLAIAGAGILWAWGSDSEEYTKKAKGWVMNIFIGLLLLFTFRYILGFLAPWIFQ